MPGIENRHIVADHDRSRTTGDGVGMAYHPAQRLQVQAGPLGQVQRFAGRGESGEGDHIAGQFHPGCRARVAGVDHQRCPAFEDWLDPLVNRAGRTDHGGQVTGFGSAGTTADRCVDHVQSVRLPPSRQLHDSRIGDGGVDRDHGARRGVPGDLGDDRLHLGVVEHRDADQVGGGDLGQIGGDRHAGGGERRHRRPADVIDDQPARPIDQMPRHRGPHGAQPDIAEKRLTHDRMT